MKKILIVVSVLVFLYIYNNFFTQKMLEGVYININYQHSPINSKKADTLVLHSNNTYSSHELGDGTYKISYSINGTIIDFNPDSNHEHIIGFNTSITRLWYTKPKIIIFYDLNHFYSKKSFF